MAHEYDEVDLNRQFDWGLENRASTSGKPPRRARSILYDAKQYGYVPPPMNRAGARVEIPPFDRMRWPHPIDLRSSALL